MKVTHTRVPQRVVVAGATGFVGRALGPAIAAAGFEVVGLSRRARRDPSSPYRFVEADLFSLLDVERALVGARFAVYLVHSMMPSARLTQGSFRDMDLICADNFARAAASAGVEQIVYVGGMIPESDDLSPHLASRAEVEGVLGAHGVPVTTLRAGLILGAGGSSFEMLERLVRRLPAMVCPAWTATPTQPVALADVVALVTRSLGHRAVYGRNFDVGVPEVMSYRTIMQRTAALLGLKRRMVNVRFFSPGLSRLWVSLVTGAPRALVAPLLVSLKHPMVARDATLYALLGVTPTPFDDAVRAALGATRDGAPAPARRKPDRVARSVQRLALPAGRDARWATDRYLGWLPAGLRPFLRVEVDGDTCRFRCVGVRRPLLVLRRSTERSGADRQLLYVVGGLLARSGGRGRLELREVPTYDARGADRGERSLICAIHDFEPRLPWFIYVATQAQAHTLVMRAFGRHLARLGPTSPSALEAAPVVDLSLEEPVHPALG